MENGRRRRGVQEMDNAFAKLEPPRQRRKAFCDANLTLDKMRTDGAADVEVEQQQQQMPLIEPVSLREYGGPPSVFSANSGFSMFDAEMYSHGHTKGRWYERTFKDNLRRCAARQPVSLSLID